MTTLVPSFFDGSSSFMQVISTPLIACMSLNFSQIPSPVME